MCDDLTAADNDRFLGDAMTRRGFGAAAAVAGIGLLLPSPANALAIKGRDVTITTPDGVADAYFVAPASGKHPAVLVWPDIMGLRPAFRQMADRLAQSGYAVLTVNQFYRSTKAPFVTPGRGFDQALGEKVGPWRKLLTPDATSRDANAFVTWLDKQAGVDSKRGIGSTGYCMGGPMVMLTAAGSPGRGRRRSLRSRLDTSPSSAGVAPAGRRQQARRQAPRRDRSLCRDDAWLVPARQPGLRSGTGRARLGAAARPVRHRARLTKSVVLFT